MFFKKKEINYFRYPLEKKVDFYFDVFFNPIKQNHLNIHKFETEIKQLIFNELDSFEFNLGRYQVKREKHSLRIQKLHSELGHLTNDWSIDWSWIIHHITFDYLNTGKAIDLIDNSNTKNVLVYKYMPDKYFDFAKDLYLKNIETKEPKIFELRDILKNGHGLKPNIKSYVPLVGVTLWKGFDNEYWDLTELRTISESYHWDAIAQGFKPNEIIGRRIRRTSKIKIYVGGIKKYDV